MAEDGRTATFRHSRMLLRDSAANAGFAHRPSSVASAWLREGLAFGRRGITVSACKPQIAAIEIDHRAIELSVEGSAVETARLPAKRCPSKDKRTGRQEREVPRARDKVQFRRLGQQPLN